MGSRFESFPLVVGTVGHRDLRSEDVLVIEELVEEIFVRIRREYLFDGSAPIILLSSLAEGADQLVARVGLRQGVKLVVPLPMALNEYRKDFGAGLSPNAEADFDALLDRATAKVVMDCPKAISRDDCYRAAGIFVARHSHLLIALWDGHEENQKVGGTAESIDFFCNGLPLQVSESARRSLDLPNKRPIIHIVTPRRGAKKPSGDVGIKPWGLVGAVESGDRVRWEIMESILSLTKRFNQESAAITKAGPSTTILQQSVETLFADSETGRVIEPARQCASREADRWCSFYALSDVLAQRRQHRFKHDWILLSAIGFGTFVSFELFSHALHEVRLMALYAALFLIATGLLSYARFGQHQERFLDYRALAEALRVGVFWKLIRLGRSVAEAYPMAQPSELAWVKTCLRTTELMDLIDPPAIEAAVTEHERLEWARKTWINGQREYFARQGMMHKRRAEALKCVSMVLLVLSPVVAAIWLGIDYLYGGPGAWIWALWEGRGWWIFTIGALPGAAAVVASYSEQLAFDAQAHQYARMEILFANANALVFSRETDSINAVLDTGIVCDVCAELGTQAMQENADWVALYRQRPIRLPRA